LESRSGHYFTPAMLESQFAVLEEPAPDESDILTVDINQPLPAIVEAVLKHIGT
jgi:gluconokinase